MSQDIRMLLVEDSATDARLIQGHLRDGKGEGKFQVVTVDRLAAVRETLREGTPDVILLDLNLPDSAGLTTVDEVVALAPRIPVVVLTGLDDEETGLAAIRKGVQDYLVKNEMDGNLIRRTLTYAIDRQSILNLLSEQLELEQDIVDAVPLPLFYVDSDGVVIGCNATFEGLMGRSRTTLLGDTVEEMLPDTPLTRLGGGKGDPIVAGDFPLMIVDSEGVQRRFTAHVSPFGEAGRTTTGWVLVLV